MEAFISRKRPKTSPNTSGIQENPSPQSKPLPNEDEGSTDLKLATLSSLFPTVDQATLLDLLVSADGSVEAVFDSLSGKPEVGSPRKRPAASVGYQTSLSAFRRVGNAEPGSPAAKRRVLTKKGQTLHLYTPEDIAAHTPCSIIHNFLPAQEADNLLRELLEEAPTFERQTFKLFDNVVQSPHSACFYVDSLEERERQKTEYLYNGSYLEDIRQITPQMRTVSNKVQPAVNEEITKRIRTNYPDGKKLKYQSPYEWVPNAAFVNCYQGGSESVGYHCDQLTYLGPRAIIGSLSLGVAREFRVRKIVARDDEEPAASKDQRADAEGQISIHLPHNSLLVMHAEMQEEWKHSIHPSSVIDPHPIAGNKRINVTYRYYRESFHPMYTPRCKCEVATVLRCVQRKKENKGRYMWMCHAGLTPGKDGCTFFQWAEFDDDGEPPWAKI
ncbi:hypothetical protein HO173_012040 [Letharia columbiana]|uniref:Fe2OG dioxygenase domain-containing protein n=1 Tax=Letharia columbiana TaxID=112416 RepID=A0A8H6CQF2_9LECA|nr:uncharacterized protein HO173_012040 [Letharia columbiana]KAF6227710.1 hypothetical protein HO173_012040 [Letharia columbiana]